MNSAEGRIVSLDKGIATVCVEAPVACARCAAGRGCGAGLLQQGRRRLLQVRVASGLQIEAGDSVRLELEPRHLLRAAWLAYGLPLACMVAAVAAAAVLVPANEGVALAAGIAGVIAGLVAGRRNLQRGSCLQQLVPVVSARVCPGSAASAPDGSTGAGLPRL